VDETTGVGGFLPSGGTFDALPMPLGSLSARGLAGPKGTPLIGELPAPADPAGGVSCPYTLAGAANVPSSRAITRAEQRDIETLRAYCLKPIWVDRNDGSKSNFHQNIGMWRLFWNRTGVDSGRGPALLAPCALGNHAQDLTARTERKQLTNARTARQGKYRGLQADFWSRPDAVAGSRGTQMTVSNLLRCCLLCFRNE